MCMCWIHTEWRTGFRGRAREVFDRAAAVHVSLMIIISYIL